MCRLALTIKKDLLNSQYWDAVEELKERAFDPYFLDLFTLSLYDLQAKNGFYLLKGYLGICDSL